MRPIVWVADGGQESLLLCHIGEVIADGANTDAVLCDEERKMKSQLLNKEGAGVELWHGGLMYVVLVYQDGNCF